jgi:hypothetical protein
MFSTQGFSQISAVFFKSGLLLRRSTNRCKKENMMKNTRNARFQKGRGVFTCGCCGRATRDTGVQAIGSETCPQCYELAGYENMFYDDGKEQFNEKAGALDFFNEAIAKGGSREKLLKSFDSDFLKLIGAK